MYKGKEYQKGDIVRMTQRDFFSYKEFGIVNFCYDDGENNKKKLNEMSYRELQKECKRKNIIAVGTKQELISNLTEV